MASSTFPIEIWFMVGFMVLAILFFVLLYANYYVTVPPNKALVVWGRRQRVTGKGYRIISGGGRFVRPVVEEYDTLPLDVRDLTISLKNVLTDAKGSAEKADVKASVQVKIASDLDSLNIAAEHLMGKKPEEIDSIARGNVEGTIRTLLADHTIRDLETDREKMDAVATMMLAKDLHMMGLEVPSFHFLDIVPFGGARRPSLTEQARKRKKKRATA